MDVNWQNNEYYKGLKAYEKESGTTLAERNAAANPYGSHTFGGVLLTQLLPGLLVGGTEKFLSGSGLNGTTPEDEGTDTVGSTREISKFTELKQKYDKAVNNDNTNDINKYRKLLQDLGANSKNPTIRNQYALIKNKLNTNPSSS